MRRWVYYNENEPYAVEWLRKLVAAGLVADGEVDERSIAEVQPEDVRGFEQCHFFAGIAGWSLALRRAGWPDGRRVWTGSCPCQPFSGAGRGKGFADDRHLWPAWFRLITKCRPPVVLGEQVASPDGLGWFDVVQADLEGAGYAVGAADLCAAGVGAPHLRQRLYFVADTARGRRGEERPVARGRGGRGLEEGMEQRSLGRRHVDVLADADGERLAGLDAHLLEGRPRQEDLEAAGRGLPRDVADAEERGLREGEPARAVARGSNGTRPADGGLLGNADGGGGAQDGRGATLPAGLASEPGRYGHAHDPDGGLLGDADGRRGRRDAGEVRGEEARGSEVREAPGSIADELEPAGEARDRPLRILAPLAADLGVVRGAWVDADLVYCRDGKYRAVGPGLFPLAHGVPSRVGRLRAYGNTIVPPLAEVFIAAYLDTLK